MSVDEAGDHVLRFVSAAKNLTKVGELMEEVVGIAESRDWRSYHTAVGENAWRECEFDYFLISCDLQWEDVANVVAWTKAGNTLAPLMDRDAPAKKRRPLEEAAKTYRTASTETLVERAVRLGWTKGGSSELRIPPLPPRARARLAYGITKDERAKQTRVERVGDDRRPVLDVLVGSIEAQLADDLERLYVIDRLRRRGPGRPKANEGDIARWRIDVEQGLTTEQLAERWGTSKRQAERRVRQVRGLD
jgi:hypothetical protein